MEQQLRIRHQDTGRSLEQINDGIKHNMQNKNDKIWHQAENNIENASSTRIGMPLKCSQ